MSLLKKINGFVFTKRKRGTTAFVVNVADECGSGSAFNSLYKTAENLVMCSNLQILHTVLKCLELPLFSIVLRFNFLNMKIFWENDEIGRIK